jgi:hypothetical protein
MKRFYRGWSIYYSANAPVTGKFQAVKFGVSMCANTEEMLVLMINQRQSLTPECT